MGFDVFSHQDLFNEYLEKQIDLYLMGKYKPVLDFGERSPDGPFQGLQDVGRALNVSSLSTQFYQFFKVEYISFF